MGVKVKTTGLDRKRATMKKLEQKAHDMAMALAKQAAADFVYNFKTGIKEGTLKLDPLQPATIKQKSRQGFPSPSTPLYGKGGKGSYQEMMKATKITNGWKVAPRAGTHKRSGLTFKVLFQTHEFGKTFTLGRGKTTAIGAGKVGGGTVKGLVRIPPRPAGRNAKIKTLKELKKNNKEFSKALMKAIKQADAEYMDEKIKVMSKDSERVAEAFE